MKKAHRIHRCAFVLISAGEIQKVSLVKPFIFCYDKRNTFVKKMVGREYMYTIVIADDEEELRKALIRRVDWKRAGFQVVGEAENGIEALELVEKLEPDLLLTDVRMPFMSGIDLARQVREIRPTMQIAFLSGYDDFSYAQQAIRYNIISYMLKPVSASELTEELFKIRKKIDEKFAEFTQQTKQQEQQSQTGFLMRLLLDPYQEDDGAGREQLLREEAAQTGLLKNASQQFCYTVMVTSFCDENGENRTTADSEGAVHQVADKYVHHAGFYTGGRVVSLLSATRGGMEKYLHIIVEDLEQSVKRILGISAVIGVSRIMPGLSGCHEAYAQAMSAFGYWKKNGPGVYFLSDIEAVQESSGSGICDKALKLIDSSYRNPDLSLLSVSTQIAVSPNYLSALIKRSTGKTFVELLTRRRMETAKELLVGTSMKIREIAEQCGYNDQHYFSYCFKKYAGISPNVCRRQHEEK